MHRVWGRVYELLNVYLRVCAFFGDQAESDVELRVCLWFFFFLDARRNAEISILIVVTGGWKIFKSKNLTNRTRKFVPKSFFYELCALY